MPHSDDPFAFLDGDGGKRTVIKPVPGGQVRAAPRTPPHEPASPVPVPPPTPSGAGLNPVENAASILLTLLAKLQTAHSHADPDGLRAQLVQEIRAFEARARAQGVSPEDLFVARYVLCTALDEAVLNTPWGGHSNWSQQSLLITFHKEAAGGVRFFQLLEQLLKDPSRHLHLLELMYICLALGFKGKYRGPMDQGQTRLEEIREQLYRATRRERGDYERELSPAWRAAVPAARPLVRYLPLWVVAALAGGLLLASYAAFSLSLNRRSDPVVEALAGVEPIRPTRVVAAPEPPPPRPPVAGPTLERLLASDLAAGRLALDEDAVRSKITVKGEGLFGSGSAEVSAGSRGLIERIAEALAQLPGDVLVTGHTDDIPIRTLRFPSNSHLSQARAEAVVELLTEAAGPATRYRAEGRGASEPLAPNDSPANRARNRRVEVTLLRYSGKGAPNPGQVVVP